MERVIHLIDRYTEQRRNSLPAAVCTMTMLLSTRAPKWPPAAHRLIFTPLNSYFFQPNIVYLHKHCRATADQQQSTVETFSAQSRVWRNSALRLWAARMHTFRVQITTPGSTQNPFFFFWLPGSSGRLEK